MVMDVIATHRKEYPDAAFDARIETDRWVCAGTELDVAIAELLTNAVKHNPGSTPHVDVTVRDDDGWIEIGITDDGPGIEEMEQRVVTTGSETALEHGSGLGLWLVNWIVTQYGGSFKISSRDGGDGTAATVRLPAIEEGESVESVERGPTVLFR
ncbi:sensory histidine kinase AtoS [Halolamina pelagica]|uniref:histidine kinase n=2 Tax=Halolamina pelagica TaxID=699431 RepID=A0A0P7FY39_9EURY|nr:sensory histidine kinase AtoS [Halolamina pelagica]